MSPKSKIHQQGFTLIETMIVVAIIGILILLTQGFLEKKQQRATIRTAQQSANAMKQQLATIIQRDLRQVMESSQISIANPHSLQMQRMLLPQAGAQLNPSQTFSVRYDSRCVPIPNQIRDSFSNVDMTLSAAQFQQRSSCIRGATLRCQAGSYPQVRVQAPTGARVPIYEPTLFPNLSVNTDNFRQGPVGAMICVSQSGNQVTVNLDVLYLRRADNGEQAVDLVSESSLAVIGNITRMPVLRGANP